MPGSGYGVSRGEKRGSFQRTGLHASRILVSIQGCKTAAMQFNHRPLLLDLGEKGVYSSYTHYSTPRDSADTLDYQGIRDISRLMAGIARGLARNDTEPD